MFILQRRRRRRRDWVIDQNFTPFNLEFLSFFSFLPLISEKQKQKKNCTLLVVVVDLFACLQTESSVKESFAILFTQKIFLLGQDYYIEKKSLARLINFKFFFYWILDSGFSFFVIEIERFFAIENNRNNSFIEMMYG